MTTPFLLVEDRFDRGAEDFLEALYGCTDQKRLKAFAMTWIRDPRAFAREAVFAYVDDGCDRLDHRALVKKLYKEAEDREDDLLLARFVVAFDGMIRRRVEERRTWDWSSGQRITTWVLGSERRDRPWRRFSTVTRQYLQRRVMRYFRSLPDARYLAAATAALRAYPADAFAQPEAVLGAFGLCTLLFRHSPALRRTPRQYVLVGRLADLAPAPERPDVWTADALLALVDAPNGVVRAWALGRLRADPPDLPLPLLLAWIGGPYPDLRAFAVERMHAARGLESLGIATWLTVLGSDDATVLAWAGDAFVAHVRPDRLTTAQLVDLCSGRSARVAHAAWTWLADRGPDPADVATVLVTHHGDVRRSAAAWMADRARAEADPLAVRDLLDATHADVRAAGLALLAEAPFTDAAVLWAAMAESPFADVTDRLLPHLEDRRVALPAGAPAGLWASTLLAVHRGAANKRRALRQLRERLVTHPDEAPDLLPLLAVALRSSRPAERRSALAAVGRAVFAQPALRPAVRRHLPEVALFAEEAP